MVVYKCETCDYHTTKKANFERHCNRKTPCDTPNHTKYKCTKCNKGFGTRQAMSKHVRDCTYVEESANNTTTTTSTTTTTECSKGINHQTIINNNHISTTNTIHVHNHINVIPFDEIIRDISTGDYTQHISEDDFAKAIRDSDDIIKTIFIELFLNPSHPERHSLYLTNQRDGPCYTVDRMNDGHGTKYLQQRPLGKVTEQVIDGVTSLVDINMDEIDHGATNQKVFHHHQTIYTAGNYRPDCNDDDMHGLTDDQQSKKIREWDDSHKIAVRGYTNEIKATLHRRRKMLRQTQHNDPLLTK